MNINYLVCKHASTQAIKQLEIEYPEAMQSTKIAKNIYPSNFNIIKAIDKLKKHYKNPAACHTTADKIHQELANHLFISTLKGPCIMFNQILDKKNILMYSRH